MINTEIKKTKIKTMGFKKWTTQELVMAFDLTRITNCTVLEDWLNMSYHIPPPIKQQIDQLREDLNIYAPFWNEGELRMYFISLLLHLIDYRTKDYHSFVERSIKARKGKYLLKGKVDFMIASGKYEPLLPYFCFHEYKKEKGTADDPIGQLLSAMLVGQVLNDNQKPIYGAYVLGRNWFFVVLNDKEFCISNAYVATKEADLDDIYGALFNLKTIIEETLI